MGRRRRTGEGASSQIGLDAPLGETLEQAPLIDEPIPERSPGISAPLDDWQPPLAVSYIAASVAPAPTADFDDPDLPYWLALHRIRGIGPARFRLLVQAYGSAERVWHGDAAGWQAAGLDARTVAAFASQRRRIAPEAELERLGRLRVGALRYTDPGYPRLLAEIDLPPAILYIRGTLTPSDDWALAVVGTRRATAYGKQITERLASELARQSITIVSGLARGIDTHAHSAALEAGGRTLAVLGCGPDLVYPPENAKLAARIIEQGALVTEFPPGTQPEAGNFPARNRLISGLSLGVLVAEAPESSGALITSGFAVPGNVVNRSSAGCNRLIQDGAKLVMETTDITTELNLHLVPQQLELREALPEDPTEALLLRTLEAAGEPQHIDELCRTTELPVAQVSGTLVMLELKGLVRLVGPMTYAR
jgi:DNA processing protein